MSGNGEHRDALPMGVVRGRGAGLNPGNRYESVRLHVLGEHLDEIAAEQPDGTQVITRVYRDHSRTVVNKVDSPDVGMKWTINPYRGCEHGCIYCYARPTHEQIGFSCGLDFETKIVAKMDAAPLLREKLSSPKWDGEAITMSGVTDPYQPVEAKLKITRSCLEVMAEFGQPVGIITKSRLVLRDIDLLAELARQQRASVALSITTLNPEVAMKMEPRAAAPRARLEAVRELTASGIPVAVMVAPIVPGLTDREIPAILKAAKEAGARGAGFVMLRLPYQIKDLFLEWLARQFPDRAGHVEALIRGMRSGGLNDPRFFSRQRGEGAHAEQIGKLFKAFRAKYGLDGPMPELRKMEARREATLFDQE